MRVRFDVPVVMAAILAAPCAYAAEAETSVLVYQPSFFADQRPNTAYDMISRLPGFTFNAGETARGFAGTAGNVLIDGQRPTSKSDGLDSILIRIPAADVDHIEIIRGGAPGIDMQGQTVVANVIRKKTDSTRITATTDNYTFTDGHIEPNLRVEAVRHSGDKTFEGSASLFSNYDDSVGRGHHYIYDSTGALISTDQATDHGDGKGWSVKGAATLPLWGGTFKANGLVEASPFHSDLLYTRPGFRQFFEDISGDHDGELGLNWKGPIGNTQVELLALQRLEHDSSFDSSDDTVTLQEFRSKDDKGESIVRGTVRYLPNPNLTLETGIEGAYNFLDGETSYEVNHVPVVLPSATAKVEERRGEVFGQGTWKFSPDWLLELGARFEYSQIGETGASNQTRSFFYPKPRAVLSWAQDKDTQWRLRYEKVVGQLDFNDFIATSNLASSGVTAGNKNIQPDQRTQYEISWEKHFWEKGALVLTAMHEEIKDVVDLIPIEDPPGTFFDAPGNIGSGRNDQLTVQLTLPLDRLGIPNGLIRSTSIWSSSQVTDPVTGEKRVISGERPQNIRINFSQDLTDWNSTWGIFFYNCWDEYYYRLAEVQHREVPPAYLGVFWEYKPTPDWSIHIEADNLTRFLYSNVRTDYTGPRNTSPIDTVDRLVVRSQPQLEIQIRKTFN